MGGVGGVTPVDAARHDRVEREHAALEETDLARRGLRPQQVRLEVAARENAVSDQSIHELSDLVRKIALQDKINESRAFASDVDQSLYAGLDPGNPGLKDRGVKKAPFVVLIGANMPSILAEISFLTNPDDAAELRDPQYRQRIAESLYRGVSRYVSSLNGVRLAQAGSRVPGSE